MHDLTRTITTLRSDAIELPDLRVVVTPQKSPPIEATLGVTPLVLGSSAECDVVVPDSRVSRRHCQLRFTPRGVSLTDLGSKNGTFLRGKPVERPEPLRDGDEIRIGTATMTLRRFAGDPNETVRNG